MMRCDAMAFSALPLQAQRGGRTQDPNTPHRRSLYDLQKLIDEVFDGFAKDADTDDDARTCRAADLPAILSAFEEKRDLILLDDGEKEMLRAFTEQVGCIFLLFASTHYANTAILKMQHSITFVTGSTPTWMYPLNS